MEKRLIVAITICFALFLSGCHLGPAATPSEEIAAQYPPIQVVDPIMVGETVKSFDGSGNSFSYCVDNVIRTKNVSDSLDEFTFYDERIVTSQGEVLGNHTFVFVTVTIENLEDQEITYNLTNLRISFSCDSTSHTSVGTQCITPKGNISTSEYLFEPYEKASFTMGYQVEDEKLDYMYYHYGGEQFVTNEDQKFDVAVEDDLYVDLNS